MDIFSVIMLISAGVFIGNIISVVLVFAFYFTTPGKKLFKKLIDWSIDLSLEAAKQLEDKYNDMF